MSLLLALEGSSPNEDRGLVSGFQTTYLRSRRHQQAAWVAGMATAPAEPPAFQAAAIFGATAIRRRSTTRTALAVPEIKWEIVAAPVTVFVPAPKVIKIEFDRHRQVALSTPVYPATPITGPPALSAFEFRQTRRRRGFSSGAVFFDYVAGAPAGTASTTPAVFPSYLPRGFHKRRETLRTLRQPLESPVYPVTAATLSDDYGTSEPIQTRRMRGRRLIAAPDVLGVGAATPPAVTTDLPAYQLATALSRRETDRRHLVLPDVLGVGPAVVVTVDTAAYELTGFNARRETRRTVREALFPPVYPQIPVVQPDLPAYAAPVQFYANGLERRFQREIDAPDTPATPPVPEQPPTAYEQPKQFRQNQRRTLQPDAPLLEHPETPFVPPVDGGGGFGGGGGGGGKIVYPARRGKHAAQLLDEALDRVVAEVMYRDLLTAPEAPAAAKVVKPFSQAKRVAIPQPETVDWDGVEQDAKRLEQLVKLYEQLQARRRRIAEDDEWMMMGD